MCSPGPSLSSSSSSSTGGGGAARIAATISPFSTTFVTSTPSSWAICRNSRTGLFEVSMTSTGDGEGDTTRMSSSSESGPRFGPRFGVA